MKVYVVKDTDGYIWSEGFTSREEAEKEIMSILLDDFGDKKDAEAYFEDYTVYPVIILEPAS